MAANDRVIANVAASLDLLSEYCWKRFSIPMEKWLPLSVIMCLARDNSTAVRVVGPFYRYKRNRQYQFFV